MRFGAHSIVALLTVTSVSASDTSSSTPLAAALHAITNKCVSHESHNDCSRYAMTALSACSPDDVKCQASQLSLTYEYCRRVCDNSGYISDATRKFLELNGEMRLFARKTAPSSTTESDPIDSATDPDLTNSATTTPDATNLDATNLGDSNPDHVSSDPTIETTALLTTSSVILTNTTNSTDGSLYKSLNEYLNELAASEMGKSGKLAQEYADRLEERLRPILANFRNEIHVGINSIANVNAKEKRALTNLKLQIRLRDPQSGKYLDLPDDIESDDGYESLADDYENLADDYEDSVATKTIPTVTSSESHPTTTHFTAHSTASSNHTTSWPVPAPTATPTAPPPAPFQPYYEDIEYVTLYEDNLPPDSNLYQRFGEDYLRRIRNHLNIHAVETSSTSSTSSTRATKTKAIPTAKSKPSSTIALNSTRPTAPILNEVPRVYIPWVMLGLAFFISLAV